MVSECPETDSSDQWHITSGENHVGVFDLDELTELAARRSVKGSDLAWRSGMWEPLRCSSVPELAHLFPTASARASAQIQFIGTRIVTAVKQLRRRHFIVIGAVLIILLAFGFWRVFGPVEPQTDKLVEITKVAEGELIALATPASTTPEQPPAESETPPPTPKDEVTATPEVAVPSEMIEEVTSNDTPVEPEEEEKPATHGEPDSESPAELASSDGKAPSAIQDKPENEKTTEDASASDAMSDKKSQFEEAKEGVLAARTRAAKISGTSMAAQYEQLIAAGDQMFESAEAMHSQGDSELAILYLNQAQNTFEQVEAAFNKFEMPAKPEPAKAISPSPRGVSYSAPELSQSTYKSGDTVRAEVNIENVRQRLYVRRTNQIYFLRNRQYVPMGPAQSFTVMMDPLGGTHTSTFDIDRRAMVGFYRLHTTIVDPKTNKIKLEKDYDFQVLGPPRSNRRR